MLSRFEWEVSVIGVFDARRLDIAGLGLDSLVYGAYLMLSANALRYFRTLVFPRRPQ